MTFPSPRYSIPSHSWYISLVCLGMKHYWTHGTFSVSLIVNDCAIKREVVSEIAKVYYPYTMSFVHGGVGMTMAKI